MHTRAPLVLAVPCLLAVSIGCVRAERGPRIDARAGLLTTLGFALTDDGDVGTPAGDLSASFDAPVVGVDDALEAYGSAHVAFDDSARDVASATVVDAIEGSDLAYAVLFDPDLPWRYVVVAAHAADLVDGAELALDNESAAALVVDEETGSGYLTDGGTLHVTSASLASGGRLVAELSGGLVEVTLEEWPQNLFPFTEDGSELDQAAAAGSGSFDAAWSERGEAAGAAAFTLEVEGFGTFTADQASSMPLDELSTAIVLASSADPSTIVVALADTADLLPGAALSFDGFSTGAWLLLEDGTQVAFTEGTLAISAASLVEGGSVAGSLSVSGEGYVLPADDYPSEGEGEGEEDCSGIDTLASDFAPTTAYVDGGFGPGELPAGYDRVLTLTDGGNGMFGLLLAESVDLAVSSPYAFTTVDYEGRAWPAAMLGLATCSEAIDVEGGTLTASIAGGRLAGTLEFTSSGASRAMAFDAELVGP
ncbi:MAG: hypothetical protein IT383_15430 [Deltaproteobacteria bacterium]|nr:hypothetical protein [Deltaproteobacteria bacterium]